MANGYDVEYIVGSIKEMIEITGLGEYLTVDEHSNPQFILILDRSMNMVGKLNLTLETPDFDDDFNFLLEMIARFATFSRNIIDENLKLKKENEFLNAAVNGMSMRKTKKM